MTHDVFISHSNKDKLIAERICATLEARGIKCWISPRDIKPAEDFDIAIIHGIEGCKVVVLIFSSNANASVHVRKELHLAFENRKTVIPFRVEDVELDERLKYALIGVQWLDARQPPPLERHLENLIERVQILTAKLGSRDGSKTERSSQPRSAHEWADETDEQRDTGEAKLQRGVTQPTGAPTKDQTTVVTTTPGSATPMKVVLLYKRNAQPDEYVLKLLEEELLARGHEVFIDRHLRIGVEWIKEIESQIRSADAVVPLLSAKSVTSEMLAYEVQFAYEESRRQGKPRLLPVRVNYQEGLPEPLGSILTPIQYALWTGQEDDRTLAAGLLVSLRSPEPPKASDISLPQEGGAVPLDSKYYIVRPTDEDFMKAIRRRDSIVLVKGARQMGKTSLLSRGLHLARKEGAKVVITDLQKLNSSTLESIESFYIELGEMISEQLRLKVSPRDVWRTGRAPNSNFNNFIKYEVLETINEPLVWGMDEVDRLFTCPYGSEVFGLFRTWHNERADPESLWWRLTLAIVYATEAHLFITDQNQSPFNVGTRLKLQDFTIDQVETLNGLYGSPLKSGAEVSRFFRLLNGHPYLVRRGLHEMVEHDMGLSTFEDVADQDEGPFGDHLRRILVLLAADPKLCDEMRKVLRGGPCSTDSFHRLRSGGVIIGDFAKDARPRCLLYATYLERHIL